MSYKRPETSKTDEPLREAGPPNPVDLLVTQLLAPYCHKHGALPQPCPRDLRECAEWWLKHMQEPEQPHETYEASQQGYGAEGTRWETGYANRCRQSLRAFLSRDLSDEQRGIIVGMVKSGVPYRGDSWDFYMMVCREHERMREVGVEAYRAEALKQLRSAFGGMQ